MVWEFEPEVAVSWQFLETSLFYCNQMLLSELQFKLSASQNTRKQI